MSILALAGGVGGAKLADGLAAVLPPGELTVVVNTGDDFEHFGLHISPDIDTVTYTLAGINNQEQGWGLAGESWNCMAALERVGGETWFKLGDRDLATHLERTRRLKTESLSAITADFAARLGIRQRIVPMSDEPVRTMVETNVGLIPFQDYFVRLACAPEVKGLTFNGLLQARPSAGFLQALNDPALDAIVICPSNPFLSILPIISVTGILPLLARRRVPMVVVSPIVGGKAIKGPAAKMMLEFGMQPSSVAVADYYAHNLLQMADGIVIDSEDAAEADRIKDLDVLVTGTIMRNRDDKGRLAHDVLAFAKRVVPRPIPYSGPL
jgi:LPPG:FO 2-phospho-L-lactate transferase